MGVRVKASWTASLKLVLTLLQMWDAMTVKTLSEGDEFSAKLTVAGRLSIVGYSPGKNK